MIENEHLIATIGVDSAENEPEMKPPALPSTPLICSALRLCAWLFFSAQLSRVLSLLLLSALLALPFCSASLLCCFT